MACFSAAPAGAHNRSDDAAEPFAPSAIRWERHLRDFSQHGLAEDLLRAQRQLEYHAPRIDGQPALLYLAAWTAQASHDFDRAWYFARRLRERDPHDSAATLLEAGLWLVRGDAEEARRTCRLLRGEDMQTHLGCQIQSLGQPNAEECRRYAPIARVLESQLRVTAAGEAGSRQRIKAGWLLATLGDLAVRCNDPAMAETYYQRSQETTPSVRVLVARVAALMQTGQFATAQALLPRSTGVVALRVKRLIVLKSLGQLAPAVHEVTELNEQFSHDIAESDFSHGREMAEFYLHVLDQPERARVIAEQNLCVQREFEDLLLLEQSARALSPGNPATLRLNTTSGRCAALQSTQPRVG